MIDFISNYYSNIKGRGKFASLIRFSLRNVFNWLIPIYLIIVTDKKLKKKRELFIKDQKVIVSLTTFPKRINKVWIVIECILRQSVEVDFIKLYLSKEQFPKGYDGLPNKLQKYVEKGKLDVVFVDNDYRSHKKYYYSFLEYKNDLVITFDDDIIYPSFIIEELLNNYLLDNSSIICTRGYIVEKEGKQLKPYNNWPLLRGYKKASYDIFHTSGGGTLYPVSLFKEELFNHNLFLEKCKYADDVWLNVIAQISSIKTIKTNRFIEIFPILYKNDTALKSFNVVQSGNDKQINELLEYYKIDRDEIFSN